MFQIKSSYLTLWQRLIFVFGWVLLSLSLPMTSGFAADAGLKILPGHRPKIPGGLVSNGSLAATRQLRLAIGVSLPDEKGLDDFLAQLYDPASTNFHLYLNSDEFTARFGPTKADYQKVIEFAVTNGLTITATHGNRLLLDVQGSVENVQRAFHVTLLSYRHPTEDRNFFAPDTEPTVDVNLPVKDVQGLSDYARPHPKLRKIDASRLASRNGSAPDGSGSYFGDDFRNAYVPDTTLTGAGQAVGLVQFDGFYAGDIATYATAAGSGRTNIAVQTVLLDDYDGTPTTVGNGEVSLDIEMAMAMAPGLARIVVFEAGPDGFQNDILSAMAASNSVKNLSCCWGWPGGPSNTTDVFFKQLAAQGQSFFNATGDSDAFTTGSNSVNGVDNIALQNAPSSCPYITQVGGTTLTSGTGGVYASETVWNWGVEYGSGYDGVGSSGGVSSWYALPSWQTNISKLTGRGISASFRNIPDVALTADNVYSVSGGSGVGSGGDAGTSCAAPLWAGFMALVNQQAAANGKSPAGFINPAIYSLAAGANYGSYFHDVTTGNNTWSSSPSLYYATNGYDLCTGLGTPNGQDLIDALAPLDNLVISPAVAVTSGPMGGPFNGTSQSFLLTNTGSASLNWSLVSTSAWLNLTPASGFLAGGTQTNLAANITVTADTLATGNYTANVWFTNLTTHVTQLRQFMLQVLSPLIVTPTNGFTSTGLAGGPFDVNSQTFLLSNQGTTALNWSVLNTSTWLNVSSEAGTLSPGGQATLTVSLAAAASALSGGIYTDNLLVTNQSGGATSLLFTLQVGPLVQNGSFETGDFTGWTLNGDGNFDWVTSDGSFVHSGVYGVALGQSALGYLSQSLTTSPGQNYLVSLWLENPTNSDGASPNQFLVQWNSDALYNQTNLPFTGWTNLQFIVTANGPSTVLQFGFDDTPYYLGLDDVSVTPVSMPVFKTSHKTATAFDLIWDTTPGLVYQVQYTTNLLQSHWINLGKPLITTNDTLSTSDTNAVDAAPQRFYRLMLTP